MTPFNHTKRLNKIRIPSEVRTPGGPEITRIPEAALRRVPSRRAQSAMSGAGVGGGVHSGLRLFVLLLEGLVSVRGVPTKGSTSTGIKRDQENVHAHE